MTNEHIKQRINYLVQHGGIWDDPLDAMRRKVATNRVLACAGLVVILVDLVVDLIR